jgi:hypothetical protein
MKILASYYVHGQISDIDKFWLIFPQPKRELSGSACPLCGISKFANGSHNIFHTSLTNQIAYTFKTFLHIGLCIHFKLLHIHFLSCKKYLIMLWEIEKPCN